MSNQDFGTVDSRDSGIGLRFERDFPFPIERVWTALIDSDERAAWLASGEIELRAGAPFQMTWTNAGHTMESTVLAVDPPRMIEFYWHQQTSTDSVVRWELFPREGGTRFVLTHSFPDLTQAADALSGWHTHLEMLGALLRGEPSPWVWARWRELKAQYIESLRGEGYELASWGRQFDDEGTEIVAGEPAMAPAS